MKRRRTLIALFALALVATSALATPSTTLVSVNKTGTAAGSGYSSPTAITPNGRFVLFDSNATDLMSPPTDGSFNVYVRDLKLGTTTLVSVNTTGTAAGGGSELITPDGRFVVFGSNATDLVNLPTSGNGDAYVRDLKLGTTALISVNLNGSAGGNGFSGPSDLFDAITPNGRFVTLYSNATDLVNLPTSGNGDAYVRDLKLGTTTLVSVNMKGIAGGNGRSSHALAITPNGRFVLFRSDATDLVSLPTNGTGNVYLRDLKLGTTALVSVNTTGTAGSGDSYLFNNSMDINGRFVLFNSNATDLVSLPTSGNGDAYVRDLKLGTTTLVSVNKTGMGAGGVAPQPMALTANGRFVLFGCGATDLVNLPTSGNGDAYVRDLKLGTTTLVSINKTGTAGGNDGSGEAINGLTPNGRFALFDSKASDLVSLPTNGSYVNIYVRDLKLRTTALVSVNTTGTAASIGGSYVWSIALTPNGRYALFSSNATDLVSLPTGGSFNVYVRNLK